MDTAGTELECFKALQKQEQLAASLRINSLWEEVQKQKELEQTLQKKYGDLIVEKEKIGSLVDTCRAKEEVAARDRACELAEAKAKKAFVPSSKGHDAAQVEADSSSSNAQANMSVENDFATSLVQSPLLHSNSVLKDGEDLMLTDDGNDDKVTDNLANGVVGEDLAPAEVPEVNIGAEAQEKLEDGEP